MDITIGLFFGGKLQVDTNLLENSIQPVPIVRENYMLAGSLKAADWGGILYALMLTCKLHDIDSFF